MTFKHTKAFALFAFAGALSLIASSAANAQSETWDRAAHQLEGTWLFTVQSYNCKTGANVGPPFLSLTSFASGGTLTDTTSNPSFHPALRSPGHGVWSYEGRDDYQASDIAIITLNDVVTATQVIRQKIEIESNPNKLTSAAKVQFFKPDGTLLRSGCAKATAKRFE